MRIIQYIVICVYIHNIFKRFYALTLASVRLNKTNNDHETYKLCDQINKGQLFQHRSRYL